MSRATDRATASSSRYSRPRRWLIMLYEHKICTQGIIWGINSFGTCFLRWVGAYVQDGRRARQGAREDHFSTAGETCRHQGPRQLGVSSFLRHCIHRRSSLSAVSRQLSCADDWPHSLLQKHRKEYEAGCNDSTENEAEAERRMLFS